MTKSKLKFLNGALVVLAGVAMIYGNSAAASNILAANGKTDALAIATEQVTISDENAKNSSSVELYKNKAGNTYMALNVSSSNINKENPNFVHGGRESVYLENNPTDGNYSGEEVLQIIAEAASAKYGLTQKDFDKFDAKVRSSKAVDVSSNTEDLIWEVTLYPQNQSDFPTIERYISRVIDKTGETSVYVNYLYIEGTPSENEIDENAASQAAQKAIVEKYALTQETLKKFTITCKYYTLNPEASNEHVWWVNLYPANTEDYTEIGCYTAYVSAEKGEIIKLESAIDGKG